MSHAAETSEDSQRVPRLDHRARPGLVLIWNRARPTCSVLPLQNSKLELGRAHQPELFGDDERVSRLHCLLEFSSSEFWLTDRESRNGTYLNGERIHARTQVTGRALIRIGQSLAMAVHDVRPYATEPLVDGAGVVLGAALRQAWLEIELAAHAGSTLYLRGESGSGKELAARAFHDRATRGVSGAPFIAVNCAAVPEGLAERLLFGAKRGAYSGATTDVEGYVQAAHRGTLFLDEIAELEPKVQAKLLRVLESREVLALGATRAQAVDLRVCVAAHQSLRELVSSGRFREDLFYRLARPEVRLAPLRERLDELPWLIWGEVARVLDEAGTTSASPSTMDSTQSPLTSTLLIEACALRHWPGNVRELKAEIRRAAHRAIRAGAPRVGEEHLDAEAGQPLRAEAQAEEHEGMQKANIDDVRIREVLTECGGNVSQAARVLGWHRNQLRRWLAKQASPNPDAESPTLAAAAQEHEDR
ncbi:MAG TPA: sigma 54-interacting transcriptional regulator [Polyangiaceae bacterium]|nr:sigma 54-interacting transcriptional regulator [Polyangiaceae bacterium]